MPLRSRAKACDNCRRAKARCSLAAPCARCADRGLGCHYTRAKAQDPGHGRGSGFRTIRPAAGPCVVDGTEHRPEPKRNHAEAGNAFTSSGSEAFPLLEGSFYADLDPEGFGAITDAAAGADAQVQELVALPDPMPQLFHPPEPAGWPLARPSGSHSSQRSQDSNFSIDLLAQPRLLSFDLPVPATWVDNPSTAGPSCRTQASRGPGMSPMPGQSHHASRTKAPTPQLSQRARSIQQGSLTARMLFSRLADYTRMMADGKSLPPFIHAPCLLASDECPEGSRHTCLPESLAVCANLTQMFHTRLPGSHAFVWQQIRMHLLQMREEYESYDEQKMLHALQAAAVYALLCAQCTESVSAGDCAWFVETIKDFTHGLYATRAWVLNADHTCSSRSQWVLMESLRRVACLLYLFDLLLQVEGQTPSKGQCPEFFDLPLPCVREIWQAKSDIDWRRRYWEHISARKQSGRRGLTLGNLFLLGLSSSRSRHIAKYGRVGCAEDLAQWCEGVDDLSMLLWMALSVEGEGQAHMNQKGALSRRASGSATE